MQLVVTGPRGDDPVRPRGASRDRNEEHGGADDDSCTQGALPPLVAALLRGRGEPLAAGGDVLCRAALLLGGRRPSSPSGTKLGPFHGGG